MYHSTLVQQHSPQIKKKPVFLDDENHGNYSHSYSDNECERGHSFRKKTKFKNASTFTSDTANMKWPPYMRLDESKPNALDDKHPKFEFSLPVTFISSKVILLNDAINTKPAMEIIIPKGNYHNEFLTFNRQEKPPVIHLNGQTKTMYLPVKILKSRNMVNNNASSLDSKAVNVHGSGKRVFRSQSPVITCKAKVIPQHNRKSTLTVDLFANKRPAVDSEEHLKVRSQKSSGTMLRGRIYSENNNATFENNESNGRYKTLLKSILVKRSPFDSNRRQKKTVTFKT